LRRTRGFGQGAVWAGKIIIKRKPQKGVEEIKRGVRGGGEGGRANVGGGGGGCHKKKKVQLGNRWGRGGKKGGRMDRRIQ